MKVIWKRSRDPLVSSSVIRSFNRKQLVAGVFAILVGLFCSWLGYLFFRYVPTWALSQFGLELSAGTEGMIGWLGVLAIFSSGYAMWAKGGGFTSLEDSILSLEPLTDFSTGGAYAVHRQLAQVTASSHLLSQTFLAGPLMLLNGIKRIRLRVPASPSLEERLVDTLSLIRAAEKWQGLNDYPGREEEIRYLARIGAIDFGNPKGIPRFKINKHHGS